jgi:hypothetical protein
MLGLSRQDLEAMNLQQLRARDPAIEQVLGQAGHVSLYDFDCGTAAWRKKGVEGPLFVVKRGAYPRFQFVILNRLGTDCLVQDVLGDFELELNEPYLLYKNSEGEVQGIWFYKVRECGEVVALIQKLRKTYAGAGAAAAPEKPEKAEGADAISGLLGMIDQMDAGGTKVPQAEPAASGPDQAAKPPAKTARGSQKAKKAAKAAKSPQRILQRPGNGNDVVDQGFEIPAVVSEKKRRESKDEAVKGAKGLTRDSLRAALVRVVQSDAFVDMLYEELTN